MTLLCITLLQCERENYFSMIVFLYFKCLWTDFLGSTKNITDVKKTQEVSLVRNYSCQKI